MLSKRKQASHFRGKNNDKNNILKLRVFCACFWSDVFILIHIYKLVSTPGPCLYFRFISELVGSPGSSINFMSKVKFPNFGPFSYMFQKALTRIPKSGGSVDFAFLNLRIYAITFFQDPSRKLQVNQLQNNESCFLNKNKCWAGRKHQRQLVSAIPRF